MKEKLEVQGLTIAIHKVNDNEFLSLTDIARRTERDPNDVLREWLSNQDTLSFLETWERIHNPDFKPSQMGGFRRLVSDKRKALGAQTYIRETGAIGITSIAGRMESANALLLEQGFNREERFVILCRRAKRELDLLETKSLTSA